MTDSDPHFFLRLSHIADEPARRQPFAVLAGGVLIVAGLLILATGCASGNLAAETPASAEQLSAKSAGTQHTQVEIPDPKPPAESVQGLPEAVATTDFCVVFAAIERIEMSDTEWDSMARTVDAIIEAMIASEAFVPEPLVGSWSSLIDGMEEVSVVLEQSPVDVEELRAVSTDSGLVESDGIVSEWAMENCDH